MDSYSIRRMEKSAGLAWINICTAINLSRPQLDLIQNLSLSPRARIHFFLLNFPRVSLSAWLEKVTERSSTGQKRRHYYVISETRKLRSSIRRFLFPESFAYSTGKAENNVVPFSWQTFHRLVERKLFLFHHVCGCKKKFNMILRNCAQIFTQKQFRRLGSSCFR